MSMSSSISRFLVLCQAEFLTNSELRGLVKPADQCPRILLSLPLQYQDSKHSVLMRALGSEDGWVPMGVQQVVSQVSIFPGPRLRLSKLGSSLEGKLCRDELQDFVQTQQTTYLPSWFTSDGQRQPVSYTAFPQPPDKHQKRQVNQTSVSLPSSFSFPQVKYLIAPSLAPSHVSLQTPGVGRGPIPSCLALSLRNCLW